MLIARTIVMPSELRFVLDLESTKRQSRIALARLADANEMTFLLLMSVADVCADDGADVEDRASGDDDIMPPVLPDTSNRFEKSARDSRSSPSH